MKKTINYHLTKKCNYRCRYCFAKFNDISRCELSKSEQIQIIHELAAIKEFNKINFVGGEPTLIPYIQELIREAKSLGFETSLVTNGSRINKTWIKETAPYLDILALSVDSINDATVRTIGSIDRTGATLSTEKIKEIAQACTDNKIHLKINTVVSQYNKNEKLSDLINEIKPFRWKILQATKVKGQNDTDFEEIAVSAEEYDNYCKKNALADSPITIITETNEIISGSYVMVDCLGRFFDSASGQHHYSSPILEVGAGTALSQIHFDESKFIQRKGNYSVANL
ncbi:MAG: viperin family antiviral radical SAM protein [Bacteroidales bacterium]|nr:viperin family antiviral radical SAM protein [Bacteroidales bacterium]